MSKVKQSSWILTKLNDERWMGDLDWVEVFRWDSAHGEVGVYSHTGTGAPLVYVFLLTGGKLELLQRVSGSGTNAAIDTAAAIADFAGARLMVQAEGVPGRRGD